MSKVDAVKTIQLTELENSDTTHVYVLNNSNPKGLINFQCNDGLGNSVTIVIPITWIPVDLTTQVIKNSLVTNPQFRRLVSGKMLLLAEPKAAEEILASREGSDELKRIFDMYSKGFSNDAGSIPSALKPEAEANNVSGFILNLVSRSDTDEQTVMAALKGQESSLTESDYRYLLENSMYSEVKQWSSQHLLRS